MKAFRDVALNFVLLLLAVLLFALPHPNVLSPNGFPFLAWFALVPVFLLVRRVSFRSAFFWGGAYGALSYALFSYWLAAFHPLALYVVAAIYFFFFLVAFPLLKLADLLFPRRGFIVQWVLWIGFEYIKTLGFTGYSYGIIGYSQWRCIPLIQIASVFGVWGVSALVAFPSAWIAGAIHKGPDVSASRIRAFAARHWVSALLWGAALSASLAFGAASIRDYSGYPQATLALVQPNSDPWKGGINSYRRDFSVLARLTDAALAANPDVSLVVWPETAFIPRIDWHYRYREDRASFELVSDLLNYLDRARVPFLIGNDDAVQGRVADGTVDRIDYNAVLLFRPGDNVVPPRPERYRKMHLVPFTESFPYRKTFPWVYELLLSFDTHFWEPGSAPTVFEAAGLRFSTPICFEDTFGYLSRRFVNSGARAIINVSNDAWARNIPCQYQHLSMSVFRSVENRVPLVRSTASGQTCVVDPNGRVTAMAEPFAETALIGRIPVLSESPESVYRICGDLFGVLFAAGGLFLLAVGVLTRLRKVYEN